jgi:hypothetical protein
MDGSWVVWVLSALALVGVIHLLRRMPGAREFRLVGPAGWGHSRWSRPLPSRVSAGICCGSRPWLWLAHWLSRCADSWH